MDRDRFEERMRESLGQTAAVDPEAFRKACEDLDVWEDGEPATLYETMVEAFGDDAMSAAMRFLDLQESLVDGTLAEFQWTTDEEEVATPFAVIEAAAIAPLDEATARLDRKEWFDEIMRRLAD